jgi:hypothetical protein
VIQVRRDGNSVYVARDENMDGFISPTSRGVGGTLARRANEALSEAVDNLMLHVSARSS